MAVCFSMWSCDEVATCPAGMESNTLNTLSVGQALMENGWQDVPLCECISTFEEMKEM